MFVIVKESEFASHKVFGGYGPTINDTIWWELYENTFCPTLFRTEAEAQFQRNYLEKVPGAM